MSIKPVAQIPTLMEPQLSQCKLMWIYFSGYTIKKGRRHCQRPFDASLFINRNRNIISRREDFCKILCIYDRCHCFIVDCNIVKSC